MSQKKKQETETSQSVWAGVMRIWGACKDNPLGALVIALGSIVLVGILNSLLSNFYDSCGKAMSNASVGFWRKFVDLYYISAAKAELTDTAVTIYITIQYILICVVWVAASLLRFDVDELKSDLSELDDIEKDITSGEKESVESNNDICASSDTLRKSNANELRERIGRLRGKLLEKLKKANKSNFWRVASCLFFTVIMVFMVTIDSISYKKLKEYRHRVSAIRPFITTIEQQTLDRQWILMRSKLDHQKIMEKIKVYEKRAENQPEEDTALGEHDN